jgi:hypothetical protein
MRCDDGTWDGLFVASVPAHPYLACTNTIQGMSVPRIPADNWGMDTAVEAHLYFVSRLSSGLWPRSVICDPVPPSRSCSVECVMSRFP